MIKSIAFTATAALAAVLATPALAQDPAARMLTPEQVASDIALAEEAYSRVHPGYTRYADADDLAAAWQQIIAYAEARDGMSVGELYIGVSRVLATIRCDHTKAELPDDIAAYRNERPVYLPLRWEVIEGRGLVADPAGIEGLQRGDEIVAVDGYPLAQMVAEIEPLIPVDGYTEWARAGEMSASFEFMGGAVDHFGALLWGYNLSSVLTIRSASGEEREVRVERVTHDAWLAIHSGGAGRDFPDAVTFERIGDNAAYLRIDTFVNYRNPVDPAEVYDPIFAALREEGRDKLILDLRSNGGGSDDAANGLLARLIGAPYRPVSETRLATIDHSGLEEHVTTWDQRAINPPAQAFIANDDGTYTLIPGILGDDPVIQPHPLAFGGELLVLTSTANSSGSTNIITWLDGLGRATTVGEATGGSSEGPTAGILFTLNLPESGIRTRLPLMRSYNNVPNPVPGYGVMPDVIAPMTIEAFRDDRDPALEAAQALALAE